jgi:hypothetical protein
MMKRDPKSNSAPERERQFSPRLGPLERRLPRRRHGSTECRPLTSMGLTEWTRPRRGAASLSA